MAFPEPSRRPFTLESITLPSVGMWAKYNLPHIWDKVLFATPELKIK